jgi:hypothetical protein
MKHGLCNIIHWYYFHDYIKLVLAISVFLPGEFILFPALCPTKIIYKFLVSPNHIYLQNQPQMQLFQSLNDWLCASPLRFDSEQAEMFLFVTVCRSNLGSFLKRTGGSLSRGKATGAYPLLVPQRFAYAYFFMAWRLCRKNFTVCMIRADG